MYCEKNAESEPSVGPGEHATFTLAWELANISRFTCKPGGISFLGMRLMTGISITKTILDTLEQVQRN